MKNFVTPHCHQASLDTGSLPEFFAKKEIELGTGYLTVTDHGTLSATRKVYELAQKNKLKPILGVEGYFRDDTDSILKDAGVEKDEKGTYKSYWNYGHITLHALNQKGYETLIKVNSRADINKGEQHGSERKPIFNWNDLEEICASDVTVMSGCLGGIIQAHICRHSNIDIAIAYYEKLRNITKPGNFYVELFPHSCDREWRDIVWIKWKGIEEKERFPVWKQIRTLNHGQGKVKALADKYNNVRFKDNMPVVVARMENKKWVDCEPAYIEYMTAEKGYIQNECLPWCPDGDLQAGCNNVLAALACKYGDPVVISDDAHFTSPDEKIVQDIKLTSMSGGNFKFYNSYHRYSSEDAYRYFSRKMDVSEEEFEKWVDNGYEWAHKFNDFKLVNKQTLPVSFYPQDTLQYTMQLIDQHGRMDWDNKEYVDRLEREINLLHLNGTLDLLPYLFTVEQVCDIYEKNEQLCGPGRGSAAGVLLSYLKGITHVDPLRYDLSLERFLTKTRIASGKLPDIDQDLPDRDILIGSSGINYLEIEMEDGTIKEVIKGTRVKTENGIVDIEDAFKNNLDIQEIC